MGRNCRFNQSNSSLSLSLSLNSDLNKSAIKQKHSAGNSVPKDKQNAKTVRGGFYLTKFACELLESDPHFEKFDTWSLIHHNIAINQAQAPVFYYFFNEFDLSEFTRNDFELSFRSFLESYDINAPDRSIKDDVNIIFNSYCQDNNIKTSRDFEDISHCPLTVLNLIEFKDSKRGVYRKVNNINVSDEVILNVLEKYIEGKVLNQKNASRQTSFELPLDDARDILKPFNFDRLHLISRLTELDKSRKLIFNRTAGLDTVRMDLYDINSKSRNKKAGASNVK